MKIGMKPISSLIIWATVCAAHNGFYVDPEMPDGHYRISYSDNDESAEPLVKRLEPETSRWRHFSKRKQGGSGEYNLVVDEDTQTVESVNYDLHGQADLPLPVSEKGCFEQFGNYTLDQDDYLASKYSLYNWCKMYSFTSDHIELSLKGNVAVYACNRNSGTTGRNYCSEGEFKAAEAIMNQTCGTAAAYTFMHKWAKEYGRTWKGLQICSGRAKLFRYTGSGDWGPFKDQHAPDIGKPRIVHGDDDDDGHDGLGM